MSSIAPVYLKNPPAYPVRELSGHIFVPFLYTPIGVMIPVAFLAQQNFVNQLQFSTVTAPYYVRMVRQVATQEEQPAFRRLRLAMCRYDNRCTYGAACRFYHDLTALYTEMTKRNPDFKNWACFSDEQCQGQDITKVGFCEGVHSDDPFERCFPRIR